MSLNIKKIRAFTGRALGSTSTMPEVSHSPGSSGSLTLHLPHFRQAQRQGGFVRSSVIGPDASIPIFGCHHIATNAVSSS